MSIELKDVSFIYPRSDAGVLNVSLNIRDGELLAIIGSSGSGKTTLLKLIAGILSPQSGVILIDGEDVTSLPVGNRNLGIVFQSYALFPHMRVWQNVAYPLKVRKIALSERKDMAIAALSRVGLKGFHERRPGTMSGGQQQRVALARALIFHPKALLLDEPLSALDAGLRDEMRDEIRRLQREHQIATVHITHDQEEALSMADRVAVMEKGHIVQVATPLELYDSPATRTIAGFVGKANLWEATVASERSVSSAFGILRTNLNGLEIGRKVTILVRPEKIVIGQASDGINCLNGEVQRDRFLGAVRRYDFSVNGKVLMGETRYRGNINTVHIPPAHIQLLGN